ALTVMGGGLIASSGYFAGTAMVPDVAGQSLQYKMPRTPLGQPDLRGIWQVVNSAAWDLQDHAARLGVPAGLSVVDGNEIPYQPWALAKKHENFEKRATADPETKCFLPGVPRITYMGYPFQIFQAKDYVAILYEYIHTQRIIYTDGRGHRDGFDAWMGDPRGH